MDADVVVLGAGFAGVAAARNLQEAGTRVVILEARDRIGGRTWYREMPGAGVSAEYGGMFFSRATQPHLAARDRAIRHRRDTARRARAGGVDPWRRAPRRHGGDRADPVVARVLPADDRARDDRQGVRGRRAGGARRAGHHVGGLGGCPRRRSRGRRLPAGLPRCDGRVLDRPHVGAAAPVGHGRARLHAGGRLRRHGRAVHGRHEEPDRRDGGRSRRAPRNRSDARGRRRRRRLGDHPGWLRDPGRRRDRGPAAQRVGRCGLRSALGGAETAGRDAAAPGRGLEGARGGVRRARQLPGRGLGHADQRGVHHEGGGRQPAVHGLLGPGSRGSLGPRRRRGRGERPPAAGNGRCDRRARLGRRPILERCVVGGPSHLVQRWHVRGVARARGPLGLRRVGYRRRGCGMDRRRDLQAASPPRRITPGSHSRPRSAAVSRSRRRPAG